VVRSTPFQNPPKVDPVGFSHNLNAMDTPAFRLGLRSNKQPSRERSPISKVTPMLVAFVLVGLGFGAAARGQERVIWNGPPVTFTRSNGGDPTDPANQDRITDTVWLTRAATKGIFNIASETGYSATSPAGTMWAFGTTADIDSLTFQTWVSWNGGAGGGPPGTVGRDAVLHLVTENIYIDIKFTAWTQRAGAGFAYIRSTENSPPDPLLGGAPVDGLPGWFFSEWFGFYNTTGAPWLFHAQHSFIYRFPDSTSDSMFIYDDTMGVWWWTSETNYPFLYVFDPPADNGGTDIASEWVFYFEGSSGPRSFGVVTGDHAGEFLFFGP
jgi:hypothetical protein